MVQTDLCAKHPGLLEGLHIHDPGQLGDDGQAGAGRAAAYDQPATDTTSSRISATETPIH